MRNSIISNILLPFAMIFSCMPWHAAAQETRKIIHSIRTDVRAGNVAKTDGFFLGENASGRPINATMSAHLKYGFRFGEGTVYGRMYPHTYQGIGIGANTFFNHGEMGTPALLYVFQGSRIAGLTDRLSLDYEWNFGASFGWKKYDPDTNPMNVVVGSDVNAYINLGFILNWQAGKNLNITGGIDLSHYSNGNTSQPNAGVNTIGGRISAVYTFDNGHEKANTGKDKLYGKERTDCTFKPYVSYDLVLYGATRTRGVEWPDRKYLVPGSFAVAGFNFNPLYNLNKYFRAGLSLDLQFDESANIKDHVAGDYNQQDQPKFHRPPFIEQFSAGLSLRAELVMPIFSVNVGVGRNIICRGNDTDGFYQVFILKTSVTRRLFLHVGYQLYNFKDPNNLMLGIGYRLF